MAESHDFLNWTPREVIVAPDEFDPPQDREFYGMSSDRAMEIHGARKDGYRGAEGKDIKIPYKGTVEDTLTEIIGGVRSACTYIGATKIKDMPKCATFVQVLQQENQVFNLFE